MNARKLRTVRVAAVVATVAVVGAVGGTAYADTVQPSLTVYPGDSGVSAGAVTALTVAVHTAGAPALGTTDSVVDSTKDDGDGGSAICRMYLTRPDATPQSPRDGDIYVEGTGHLDCASTRVDADFVLGIEWRLDYGVNGSEGSSGTRIQQGPTETCSQRSRCPANHDARAPWGHVSRCYETGTYYATTVVISGYYWYRGTRYSLGGLRSATTSGTYGKGC